MLKRLMTSMVLVLLFALGAIAVALLTHPDLQRWGPYRATTTDTADPGNALSITWLGTATVLISDGETHLLTDGFFSRPSLWQLVSGPISPDRERIKQALHQAGIVDLDAVLVLHSHYDHAMDAPLVAQQTGAPLVGSASSLNVGYGLGLVADDMIEVVAGEPLRFGDFEVIFLNSDHVPQSALVDAMTGMNEDIDSPLTPPAWINEWKEGESWTVLVRHPRGTILLQGSAGFRPGQLDGYQADLALVSSTGLFRQSEEFRRGYYANTVAATDAAVVVPLHWDDFFSPLRLAGKQSADGTPPLPWLAENLHGSFAALQKPASAEGRRFMLVAPGQQFWFRAAPSPGNSQSVPATSSAAKDHTATGPAATGGAGN